MHSNRVKYSPMNFYLYFSYFICHKYFLEGSKVLLHLLNKSCVKAQILKTISLYAYLHQKMLKLHDPYKYQPATYFLSQLQYNCAYLPNSKHTWEYFLQSPQHKKQEDFVRKKGGGAELLCNIGSSYMAMNTSDEEQT